MALERFIPQTPDPYIKNDKSQGAVKFGHLNALVDAINSTIYGDYLQLQGVGPMSTTLRALEDPDGNLAQLYLATNKTAISGSLKIGGTTGNLSSAILQIDSTTQGVLFPRVTQAERDAIASPAIGLLVFNTDTNQVNAWNGSSWVPGGFLHVDEVYSNAVQLVAGITPKSTYTNAGLVLQPNGTGAIMAQVPDGTVAGGNARGQYAVDLQMYRNTAFRVASGNYSTIVGGGLNTSSGEYSLTGGYRNTANGQGNVAMGWENTTSNAYSIAFGVYNNSSSNYSTVSGGQSNTASTNSHATVVGGYQNTSSGQYSISGGYSNVASAYASKAFGSSNTASGTFSTISGGLGNSTGQAYATVVGGNGNTASQTYSIAGGWVATASGSYSVALGRSVTASGNGSVALGYNGGALADGAVRMGYFGGSMPYANGFLMGGTLNAQNGWATIPFSTANEELAAGGVLLKSLNLDPFYSSYMGLGLEISTVVYAVNGSAPLNNKDAFYQKDTFLVMANASSTASIKGSIVNVITQGDSAMLTGGVTYAITGGNVLDITYTAPTGFSGTLPFNVITMVHTVHIGG